MELTPDQALINSQFFNALIDAIPGIVICTIALIFSIIIWRRSTGKLERLLIVGSSLMLIGIILSIPEPFLIDYFSQSNLSNISAALVISLINMFLGLISLAGVICLFYAIWKKFNV